MPSAFGRLMIEPVVTLMPNEDGLRIRIDDDKKPEFWCEVQISFAELTLCMIHGTELQHPELAGKLRESLKKLTGQ